MKEQTLFKSPLQVDVPSGPDRSCSRAIKGARGAGKDGTGSHLSMYDMLHASPIPSDPTRTEQHHRSQQLLRQKVPPQHLYNAWINTYNAYKQVRDRLRNPLNQFTNQPVHK